MIGIFRRKKGTQPQAIDESYDERSHEVADGALKLAMSAVDVVIEEKRNARFQTARIIADVESFGLKTVAKKA